MTKPRDVEGVFQGAPETDLASDIPHEEMLGGPGLDIGRPGLHCSFCNKHQDDVWRMVAGPGVYVCSECIELLVTILSEEARPAAFRAVVCDDHGETQRISYQPIEGERVSESWLRQCHQCGTWIIGKQVVKCLHCGDELAKQQR